MIAFNAKFPIDTVTGYVPVVKSANAVAPLIYIKGLKLDSRGYVVIA